MVRAKVQNSLQPMHDIQTVNLCKSYGSRRGVTDIDLSVQPSQVFGFLGPNGAGKSTTIRLLLGFLKPDSGQATIFGKNCWDQSAVIKRDVGYVAGDVRLYPWLTARRAFRIVGDIRGTDLFRHGAELAERFRLEIDLPVRKMSRGNRQKLALVMALAHRPRLVILDEPTSGLDPLMQDTLADILRETAADGHSVFFSSHTLSEVEALCDRVAIVRDGQIVADEKLRTLQDRAPRTAVLSFPSPKVASACVVPSFAASSEQTGSDLKLQLHGAAAELTRWAATQPITDIKIGPPNLETLFREYYSSSPTEESLA